MSMRKIERLHGLLSAAPMIILMLLTFVAPLLVVGLYSVMPPHVFDLMHMPTLENFSIFFEQSYYRSLLWSLGMAFVSTLILFLICYPLAFAMAKIFKRFTLVITIGVVITLFVSENIRLFGWVLTLMKGGLFSGYIGAITGTTPEGWLYNPSIIVFGLVYAYFPFMLFPLVQGISMIPNEIRQAASDLGASRWRIIWEIDLPMAMPGIVVGSLLSFVLAVGAMAESKLHGGQAVIVMADEIETAFTYGQNWPLGSSLSVILIVIIGIFAFIALSRVELDGIFGRGKDS